MSPRPTKSQQRTNLPEAIKETAWKQIAQSGAPAISLRAIARELSITAPAIYNYFSDRDALVTALIQDAFTSLGVSQKEALEQSSNRGHAEPLTALALSYRSWALTYPQRYQLIFGTPIPGYRAPEDVTTPPAAWALVPLINTIQNIFLAGKLRVDHAAPCSPDLTAMLAAWGQFTGGINIEVLYTALIVWSRVHGLVSLEIGNQLPSFFTNPGEVYYREIENIKIQYLTA